jgi:hypothetical protein
MVFGRETGRTLIRASAINKTSPRIARALSLPAGSCRWVDLDLFEWRTFPSLRRGRHGWTRDGNNQSLSRTRNRHCNCRSGAGNRHDGRRSHRLCSRYRDRISGLLLARCNGQKGNTRDHRTSYRRHVTLLIAGKGRRATRCDAPSLNRGKPRRDIARITSKVSASTRGEPD